MLDNIFYIIGIVIIILNIYSLINHKKIFEINEWMSKYKKVTGEIPCKCDFRDENDLKLLITWSSIVVLTVFWMFLGLLSKNSIIFIFIFIFNILLNYIAKICETPSESFINFYKIRMIIKFIKSLIMISIISILVLSHFNLKFNIIEHIKLFFNN